MIKMVAFDVDGTLYDFKTASILPKTIEAIKALKEKGIYVVVASGRCHYGLGKALNDLKMDYIIAKSGSVLVDKDNNVISRYDFSMDQVNELINFSHETDAGLIFKFIDHMYIYQHPERIDWLEKQMNSDIGKEPFKDGSSQDHHLLDLPQSCSIHADPASVKEHFGNHPTISFIQYSYDGYDVVNRGINKGVGLKNLMEHLHLNKDEVMYFGDNYNDVEAMSMIDHPIAMGNAVDDIKKIAEYVTDSCDSDGIYKALKQYELI